MCGVQVHFLAESTAAATAYGLTVSGTKQVLIFDMGGGTTDLSIMHIQNGTLSVQGTGGNNELGGKNIDGALLELVESKAKSLDGTFIVHCSFSCACLVCMDVWLEGNRTDVFHVKMFQISKRNHFSSLAELTCCSFAVNARYVAAVFCLLQSFNNFGQLTLLYMLFTPPSVHVVRILGLQEELSSVETSSITIPNHNVGPNTTNNADLIIKITRKEFEVSAKPITDLVEATVYHMVQNWQLQQKHLQLQEKIVDNETSTVGSAVEEDTDGFVQVSTDATTSVSGCKEAAASLFNAPVPATSASESTDAPVLFKSGDLVSLVDEVVLVGGSSRVPCVRAALRRALGKAGIVSFGPDGPKELCTSLNPEEVVAEGLAIRGAVLSGVSTGKLKELLMMDCVNNAIGVMTWEASNNADNSVLSTDSTNVDTLGTRIFNSILHKGMSIPAKNTMRFPLADPNQKFVSLDIFEEVEECKRKSETNASKEIVDDVGDFEMTYTYHVVATADITVPKTHSTHSSDSGAVDITFTMTPDGILQFNVVRVEGPVHDDASASKTNMSSINMLLVYIVLMFALYLFVKITLTEAEVNMNSDNGIADTVVQSVNAIAEGVRNSVQGENVVSHFDDRVFPSAVQVVNNVVVDALGDMNL